MKYTLGLLVITSNSAEVLAAALESASGLVDQMVVVDDGSTDATREIASRYGAVCFEHHEPDLGKQRAYALSQMHTQWTLVLDPDERLTHEVRHEIIGVMSEDFPPHVGYRVPFYTHFLGRRLRHGGENYFKMVLFKTSAGFIRPARVHEAYEVKGSVGTLENGIEHYSYRSISQMYRKFIGYAKREAEDRAARGETVTVKKLTMYPIHMFIARFFESGGYKDGFWRLPLDIGFAYMEFMTYWYLLWKNKKEQ